MNKEDLKNNNTDKNKYQNSNIQESKLQNDKRFERKNRGTRIKMLSEEEMKNDDEFYDQIFGEVEGDEEYKSEEEEEDSYDEDFFNEEQESNEEDNTYDSEKVDRRRQLIGNKKKMQKDMMKQRNEMIKKKRERERERMRFKREGNDYSKNEKNNENVGDYKGGYTNADENAVTKERPRLKLKSGAIPISFDNNNKNDDSNLNSTGGNFIINLNSNENTEDNYNRNTSFIIDLENYNTTTNYSNNNFNANNFNKSKNQRKENYSKINNQLYNDPSQQEIISSQLKEEEHTYSLDHLNTNINIIALYKSHNIISNNVNIQTSKKNLRQRTTKINYNENALLLVPSKTTIENNNNNVKTEKANKYKKRKEPSALFFISENIIILNKKPLVNYLLSDIDLIPNDLKENLSDFNINIDKNRANKKNNRKNTFISTTSIDSSYYHENGNKKNNKGNKNSKRNEAYELSTQYRNDIRANTTIYDDFNNSANIHNMKTNNNEENYLNKKRSKVLKERYTEYMTSQTTKKRATINKDNLKYKQDSSYLENNNNDLSLQEEGILNNKNKAKPKTEKNVSFHPDVINQSKSKENILGFQYQQFQSYHQQPIPSQKQLLYEAIFTEIYNNQSLEELRRMEDLNKRELPNTIRKKFQDHIKMRVTTEGETNSKLI